MMKNRHYSKVLSLIGFMGCGKSTVGRQLAERYGAFFIDLDSVIEENTGLSIPEIFEQKGEKAFRAMELEHLRDMLNNLFQETNDGKFSHILSLGGGTLTTAECARLITDSTFCIYLKASPETLLENLRHSHNERPILKGCSDDSELLKRISSLLEKRSSIYEESADVQIITDGKNPEEIVSEIIHLQ